MYAIELSRVSKMYRSEGGVARPGLRAVSAAFKRGELVAVIGGNGSGKSTLLRAISGTIDIDEGRIALASTDVTAMPAYRRSQMVAFVDQDPSKSCASDLSVAETVALARPRSWTRNVKPLLIGREVHMLRRELERYSRRLSDLWLSAVSELSGGERQMLAMIAAVMRGCDSFLLDEHTAALDARNSTQVWELTKSLCREQAKTVVVVTHDIQLALDLGGRLIVMTNGVIALDVHSVNQANVSRDQIVDLYIASGRDR